MKKLLALILCVMMFVSVIPTMAFATDGNTDKDAAGTPAATTQKPNKVDAAAKAKDIAKYPWIDNPLMDVAQYKKEIENMVKNTKEDLQDAYGELISNKVVYSTAKGMDDTIVGLIDAITADLVGKKIVVYKDDGTFDPTKTAYPFTKKDVDTVKKQVRYLIDGMVATKMAENDYKYITKYNDDGSIKEIDPIKYAQVFSQAVSDSLTNKDFQKGYEAVATYFALSSLIKDVNDTLKDEYKAFYGDVDKDFDKDFEKNYPALYGQYIDTLADLSKYAPASLDDPWATRTESPVTPDNGWESRS